MMWPNMMSGYLWGGNIIGMLLGLVFFVLLVIGIIFLIVWLVKKVGSPDSGSRVDEPLQILKNRYARGEISREEYEQARKDIGRG
ncbi:MAG: SHOCT domain-containing protein [Actinomycetota bacterium]